MTNKQKDDLLFWFAIVCVLFAMSIEDWEWVGPRIEWIQTYWFGG